MNLNFYAYIYQIPAIAVAMIIHEYVKAALTIKQGDDTPATRSRLTLNPLKHIEIIGFLIMLFLGYGWSVPVETNIMNYKDRRKGTLVTYIAPSLVNLIVGLAFVIIYKLCEAAAPVSPSYTMYAVYVVLMSFLAAMAQYNVALAVFNVIPVYPMDGWRVLGLFISPNVKVKISNYEKILQVAIIILLAGGWLQRLLDPICGLLLSM